MFLGDAGGGTEGLEGVAAASAPSESGGVDQAVVGEDRGRVTVLFSGVLEGFDHNVAGDG